MRQPPSPSCSARAFACHSTSSRRCVLTLYSVVQPHIGPDGSSDGYYCVWPPATAPPLNITPHSHPLARHAPSSDRPVGGARPREGQGPHRLQWPGGGARGSEGARCPAHPWPRTSSTASPSSAASLSPLCARSSTSSPRGSAATSTPSSCSCRRTGTSSRSSWRRTRCSAFRAPSSRWTWSTPLGPCALRACRTWPRARRAPAGEGARYEAKQRALVTHFKHARAAGTVHWLR